MENSNVKTERMQFNLLPLLNVFQLYNDEKYELFDARSANITARRNVEVFILDFPPAACL